MSKVDAASATSWAEACSAAFVPLRVRSAARDFSASLEQRMLSAEVSLTAVSSEASEVYRSKRVIAQHPRDDLIVSLHRSGTGTVSQHGRLARLSPGKAAIYDAASPYSLNFGGAMREIVVQLPRHTLRVPSSALADLTARPLPNCPALSALTVLAVDSMESESAAPGGDDAVAEAMVSLLAAVTTADAASSAPGMPESMLIGVLRRYVDERIQDPELSPASLAHAHFVSLRLVQRVFAETGDSPAAYIRRQRLLAARRRLDAGEQVTTAAFGSGFRDPETFRRAFRREFGMSPSEAQRCQ